MYLQIHGREERGAGSGGGPEDRIKKKVKKGNEKGEGRGVEKSEEQSDEEEKEGRRESASRAKCGHLGSIWRTNAVPVVLYTYHVALLPRSRKEREIND